MKPPSGKPLGINFGFRIGAAVLMPILKVITKRNWLNTEMIPKSGPAVFFSNHVSYLDALVFAHYFFENGRALRFIGKEAVFKIPVVGWVLYKAEQIPVKRESDSAAVALGEAIAALKMGHAIGIYPEGTLTRDPNLWPMTGKTGAVRLAIASGAPLIPVAQWGDHEILAPYSKKLKLFPPKPISIKCGDPIDLSKWAGKVDDPAAMEEATNYAMRILADMVGELRNEPAPAQLFDLRKSNLPRTGNFRKNRH
ncbi:MAG: lysophospholipid acyltransferase family protein [Candidatus Nanopelagicaceae bacterium]|jgi:1-acyl-sn-glycerol-3-phosphate acyltransferase